MSQCRYAITPRLLEERLRYASLQGLPLHGHAYDHEDDDAEITETSPFAPHVVYTYEGFANKPHCDNDVNLWTMGFCGAVDDEGKPISNAEGFQKAGYAFAVASHKMLVDLGKRDGVFEGLCMGRRNERWGLAWIATCLRRRVIESCMEAVHSCVAGWHAYRKV